MNKIIKKWKTLLCVLLTFSLIFQTTVFVSAENIAMKTIRVDVSETDWESVNIHYFGGASSSTWPGSEMEKDKNNDKVYSFEVPADSTGIIFNSDSTGVMKQTVDIVNVRDDVIYHVQSVSGVDEQGKIPKANVIMKDDEGNVVNPEEPKIDTMSVYFDNSKTNWSSVNIHYWGSGVTGTEWPGKSMTKVEERENVYSIDVPVGITGIVFTDSSDPDNIKSSDVTDIPTKDDYEKDNSISAEYISTGYEYGKYVVLRKDANGETYLPPENPTAKEKIAKQINTHVGADYTTVYLSYTTIGDVNSKVILTDASGNSKEYTGTSTYSASAQKFKHLVVLNDLKPSTKYSYTIGEDDYVFRGTFRSIPEKGGKETVKFAFLADTQVGDSTDAKAVNSTFNILNNYKDLGFVYIGGDITDNSDSKSQWENLFECDGLYKTGGRDFLSNNLLAVAQGNHDKNNDTSSLSGYITAPNEGGNLVYSIDYGNVKLIVLNLETAKNNDEERDNQKKYLEEAVKEAKNAGQWTVVGFHKSIYTGASHIIDSDVVAARKYWSPILSQLDVDLVLQAHDHVYARGFVNGDGTRGEVEQDETGAYISKDNSPLYMVGGHAGGLKWYSAKEYTVGEGDPLLPEYKFLDIDSALGENGTDKTHESMYTIFEVNDGELTSTTYAYKYDTDTDTITKQPYVYDSLTIKRKVEGEEPKKPTESNDNNEDNDGTKQEDVINSEDTDDSTEMAKTSDDNLAMIIVLALMTAGSIVSFIILIKKKSTKIS